MAATIPDSFRDLFEKQAFANLATVMSDGTPQVSPVWVALDGEQVVVNSARGRVKDRNIRRNPAVALAISDPQNPYRHIAIRGRVVDVVEKGADEDIDRLAKRYLGQDKYPFRTPGEVRVIYRIEPTSVSMMG